jgi:hypothetical protein
LTPQLIRAGKVVRGVHVEEQELRIGQSAYLVEGEDTDLYPVVEADGAEVAGSEAGADRIAAGRAVGGAERLYSTSAVTLR